jgi:hypothetical protein
VFVISALKLRQEDHEFEVSQGYSEFKTSLNYIMSSCFKKP